MKAWIDFRAVKEPADFRPVLEHYESSEVTEGAMAKKRTTKKAAPVCAVCGNPVYRPNDDPTEYVCPRCGTYPAEARCAMISPR